MSIAYNFDLNIIDSGGKSSNQELNLMTPRRLQFKLFGEDSLKKLVLRSKGLSEFGRNYFKNSNCKNPKLRDFFGENYSDNLAWQ